MKANANDYLKPFRETGTCSFCEAGQHVGVSYISRTDALQDMNKKRAFCKGKQMDPIILCHAQEVTE